MHKFLYLFAIILILVVTFVVAKREKEIQFEFVASFDWPNEITFENMKRIWFSIYRNPDSTAQIEGLLPRMYQYACNKDLDNFLLLDPNKTYIVVCGHNLLYLSYNEWNAWGRLLRKDGCVYHGKVILEQTEDTKHKILIYTIHKRLSIDSDEHSWPYFDDRIIVKNRELSE